ncbi:uncharacterized protein LOC141638943 [Silene latifolia]|uniref:uncharacterized protein LOC141638943 n=1 Tax=Silene latifolia TaxID=37657 RepID=UPI003D76CBD0
MPGNGYGDMSGGTGKKSGGEGRKSSSDSWENKESRSISPYFLPTSDKPGDKIIHVMLNGDNYDEWSVKLHGALHSRKKIGFVNGSIKKPADDSEDLEDWYIVNAMDDIEGRFSVGNGPKTHRIKNSISSCKQGENESVTDYYGRLKRLWDDLDKYDRNPICDCGGCKCRINQKLDKKRDEGKLHDFLMGLGSHFATVCSNILLQEPLPTLNRAYATVIQEEGVHNDGSRSTNGSRNEGRADPIGFSARTGHNANVNSAPWFETGARFSVTSKEENDASYTRPRCTKCNRWGHVRDKCYDIIGYPPRRGGYRGGGRGNNGRGRGGGRAGENMGSASEEAAKTKEEYVSVPKNQWDAYVNNAKGPSSSGASSGSANRMSGKIHKSLWLLDSGATHHMTGDFHVLGEDREARTTIGTGEEHGRLYLLEGVTCKVHATRKADNEVETREKFVVSNNKVVKIFELIHCDLWSDYRTLASCGSRYFLTIVDDYSRAVWKGWEVYDVETHEFFVSRDVIFDERVLRFQSDSPIVSPAPGGEEVLYDDGEILMGDTPCVTTEEGMSEPEVNPGYVMGDAEPSRGVSGDGQRVFGPRVKVLHVRVVMRQPMVVGSDLIFRGLDMIKVSMSPLFLDKKVIGNKWVYKVKLRSDGSVERYKARLVVLGNKQEVGIDYYETFAPTAKMVTIRVFLAIVASRRWFMHQMDVHNAFLHGDLEEEVYMKLPQGYSVDSPGKVYRLKKSLYDLRQAPRCWFAKLSYALLAYGFVQSMYDYSLFSYVKENVEVHILVYVDDLVLGGTDYEALSRVKSYLGACFHMKDLGDLKYFLGIEVARNTSGVFICQRKYALDIFSETGIVSGKPERVPIEQNHKLAQADDDLLDYSERYRRIIGRLIYLTITGPDLSYSVHILSQFLHQPRVSHWRAVLPMVRYLKQGPGQGSLYRSESQLDLSVYSDSDWESCPLSRRLLTAYLVFLGGCLVSWKTKKQNIVSLSSAEAEYRSMAATTCEIKWLRGLLKFLGVSVSSPAVLRCDSQSALSLARNPVFHARTKHIEVDCHFVRDGYSRWNCLSHVYSYVCTIG